jgi:hypothetical protein
MVIEGHPLKRRRHTQPAASEHGVAALSTPSLPTYAALRDGVTQTGVVDLSTPPSDQSHHQFTRMCNVTFLCNVVGADDLSPLMISID